jgi:cobalt-zinc-cadmium efflux system outer membrane protein
MTSSTNRNRRSATARAGALAALGVLFVCAGAAAQAPALSRARIVELIGRAPATRVTEAQVAVSQAAVTAAGVLSLENPLLSAMGGMRFNPNGTRPFAGTATLSWPIDTGGKRGTRKDAATAEQREARATGDAHRRQLLLAVLMQHAAVLRDERQLAIAESRQSNAQRLLETAQKRRAAGNVPEIDVALARLQQTREAAAAATARGERDGDLLRLAALLGLPPQQAGSASGMLVPEGEPPPIEVMLGQLAQQADVKAATARVDAARARAARERSAGAPTLNVLAQYERDDGANIGMVGLAVPLPVLNANDVAKATSAAEVQAARAELDEVGATTAGKFRELYARYEATKRSRAALTSTAATVAEALALATRAYELGEGDLASVLLVQREALEAERAVLEVEYSHAIAKLELLVAAGRTPQ